MRKAELRWIEGLIKEIESRSLDGIELWENFHQQLMEPYEEGAEGS
jgi:hypothetical protein